jgi:RNA polymerase primary sigma factor
MGDIGTVAVAELDPDVLPASLPVDDAPDDGRAEARESVAAKGRDRGFVTSDDLLDALPETPLTPEQIEDFLVRLEQELREEGIEVIDVPPEDLDGVARADGMPASRREDPLKNPSYDPVRMYLKEIGRVPLLTAAQEVDLAMRIESGELAGVVLAALGATGRVDPKGFRRVLGTVIAIREHQLDPEKRLANEGIGREMVRRSYRPKRLEEAAEFLGRIHQDVAVAKRKLVEANLRLVVSIAKRYVSRGMMFLDLTQEGNLGLIRAVEKFDYTRGYKFSTYATWWIRQAITRAIADQSRVIRIPVHMTEYVNKVNRAERDLEQSLGRAPLAQEVGDSVGISAQKVEEVLKISRDPLSLETPIGEEDDARLGDFIEDHDAVEPLEAASVVMLQAQIDSVLCSLTTRERKVLELRFGLADGQSRTLEEVGKEFGITRERIRQIEAKTLSKLRHPSRSQTLRDYLDD